MKNRNHDHLINRKRLSIAVTIVLCLIVIAVTYTFYQIRWNSINLWANNIKEDSKELVALSMTMVEKLTPNIEDLLSGLIALFGIVLSIWVGLNIYSVLGKDELIYLEERSEKLSADINAMQGVIQTHKSILRANYETNLSELLSCIEQSLPHYGSSRYLMEKFNILLQVDTKKGVDSRLAVLLPEFIRIENFFLAASEAYGSKNFAERKLLSDSGIKVCQKVINMMNEKIGQKTVEPFFWGYIHLRMGDFNFYMGHRQKDGVPKLDIAGKESSIAAKIWFGIDILHEEPKAEALKGKTAPELYCLAYLYNIIGESFNVRWQEPINDRREEWIDKAEKCLGFAAKKIIPCIEENPTAKYFAKYYRNYGTVLDHKKSSECITWYKKALEQNPSDFSSHSNIASWELSKVQKWYEERCEDRIKEQEHCVNLVLQHLALYRMQCPTDPVTYGKSCWAYTLLAYIYLKLDKPSEGQKCIQNAEEFWELSKRCKGDQTVFSEVPKVQFDEVDDRKRPKDANGKRLKDVKELFQ